MTQIHLIGGEKGGVGKSVVARLLAQYFIDHGMALERERLKTWLRCAYQAIEQVAP